MPRSERKKVSGEPSPCHTIGVSGVRRTVPLSHLVTNPFFVRIKTLAFPDSSAIMSALTAGKAARYPFPWNGSGEFSRLSATIFPHYIRAMRSGSRR